MSKLKRLMAAVLTAAMLATFLPAGVLAAEGDETDPASAAVAGVEETQDPQSPQDDLEDLYVTVSGEKVYLEEAMSTFSLIPLEYHYYELELTGKFPDELKRTNISDLLAKLKEEYDNNISFLDEETNIAAWAKWYYYDEDGNWINQDHDDEYTLVKDGTIDLSGGTENYSNYLYFDFQLELIVGTADQLNPNNIRCRIQVRVSNVNSKALLDVKTYNTETPRKEIRVLGTRLVNYYEKQMLYIYVNPADWQSGQKANLGLSISSEIPELIEGVTAKVYQGYYETAEAFTAAAPEEITNQIWNQHDSLPTTGGYQQDYSYKRNQEGMQEITLVLTRNGNIVYVLPVVLCMMPDSVYIYFNELNVSGNTYSPAGTYSNKTVDGFDYNNYRIYNLYSGNKANSTYYVSMYANKQSDTYADDVDNIKGAYVGKLTLEETVGKTDIKSYLFTYSSSGGYAVNFSEQPSGVAYFTVIDIYDNITYLGLEVQESNVSKNELPNAPTPLSQDTYFRMQGANALDGNSYSRYVMNYMDDSYYYYGYQTVFLLKGDGTPVDAEKIVPTFYSGSTVTVFAGRHTETGAQVGGTKQETGKTEVEVKFEKPIQYSAAAENEKNLKNYFVTFLTQTAEPILFVNGTNDESNWKENPETKEELPSREVNLTMDYAYHHDIFFANLGKEKLANLSVTLTGLDGTGEAQNVALDEYWTIGATKELAGFTSTSKANVNGTYDSYGELPNVGKIRLVPIRDENGKIQTGEISGLLTIGAGEGENAQSVKILLTGTAGLKINTEEILDAVKYVSYSSLIQTNYISDRYTNMVSFTATGLPTGIEMKSNGELYGVPTVTGTFNNITVTATATLDGETVSDTKTYTMTVVDNSDINVWDYDYSIFQDDFYEITTGIPNEGGVAGTIDTGNLGGTATAGDNLWNLSTQLLESQGAYDTFVDRVWLDGRLLQSGTDYTSDEGSTRITLQTQTLRSAGNGTHTISAEFRLGVDKENGTLRRAAQNYTLTTLGTTSSSGGSGGGGSSSSSTSYSVNVANVSSGYGSVSVSSAKPGTKVTVTITPDRGYQPAGLTVTRSNGTTVSTVKASDTEYTFIMPSGAVTVTPSFTAIPAAVGSFYDVPAEAWFCDAVKYVFDRGLMVGTSSNTFSPDGTVSRSMLVTVLYSLEGKPPVSGVSPFTDVQPGQWFADPVIWAAENKLVAGLGNGTFGTDSSLTREQAAVILYAYAQMKGYDVTPSSDLSQFADTDSISAFALSALQWAHAAGLISGYSQDTLAPGGTATRAQLAVILRSFCENIAK